MSLRRSVRTQLTVDVEAASTVELQIAVAGSPAIETLAISIDGSALEPGVVEVVGGRVHRFVAPVGRLEISYEATVEGRAAAPAVSAAEQITYLRPSRYAEADRITAVAQAEFAGIDEPADLLAAVSSWVGGHLSYVPGSSRPTDGAVETMLRRRGVCRDYAHLVVALLRGRNVAARLAAVYAPGLDPMDFHAVAEAAVDGVWYVVDATLLAPRESLLRIATGRDAADTAFLSTYGGAAELLGTSVLAVVDGDLPTDDVGSLVSLG
jgi:transglutaminase-like putative cysteine protease